MPRLLSAVPDINWPAVPNAKAAKLVSVLHQLQATQHLPAQQLQTLQYQQLYALLTYAQATVPVYQERLAAAGFNSATPLTADLWRRIPILTRAEIHSLGDQLLSTKIPEEHGKPYPIETSGSTGIPIKTYGTAITALFWEAITIRDHLWQRRDFGGKLAAIRYLGEEYQSPQGYAQNTWGMPADAVYRTGPSAVLSISLPLEQQAEWLVRHNPEYFITYPTNAVALAEYFQAHNLRLPALKQVRTLAEAVNPELRQLARQVWNAPVIDMYSAKEAGYIALQCSETEHYHIQSETVFVEILDDRGQPCRPGEIGRVVLTPLHNFAAPLIRYEIGDYAEVGEPCPCGRGLPVLKRILGRVRNMLAIPGGKRTWPFLPHFEQLIPVVQMQFIQRESDLIEAILVTERAISAEEECRLTVMAQQEFGYPFRMRYTYVDNIPRSAAGKFEEFKSEIAAAPQS